MARRMARVRVKQSNRVSPSPLRTARCRLAQILIEAAQHLQHRVAIVQEHVAPHGGIGRGDAGEIAKTAGGIFDHLAFGDLFQVMGGAHDIVGDQMRQMRSDGQHQVVMARGPSHRPGCPAPCQKFFNRSTAAGSLPRHRRQDGPAAIEQAGEACLGTRKFRAGDGMGGNEMHVLGNEGADIANHRALDRADIRQDGAGFQMRRDLLRRSPCRRRPACRGSPASASRTAAAVSACSCRRNPASARRAPAHRRWRHGRRSLAPACRAARHARWTSRSGPGR